MMIYITGDTHGDFSRFSSSSFKEGKILTKKDFVIIAGDFGGIWDVNQSSNKENYWLNWLNDKSWTTLVVDGNHENFDRLNNLDSKEMFENEVGIIRDSIFHLKRGYIYNIDNKKIFVFGGASSIDKENRIEYISWWSQEIPNFKELKRGISSLDSVGRKVDYIITHTCSQSDFYALSRKVSDINEWEINDSETSFRNYLEDIKVSTEYKMWYCGHFHHDFKIMKTQFLYNNIKEIV